MSRDAVAPGASGASRADGLPAGPAAAVAPTSARGLASEPAPVAAPARRGGPVAALESLLAVLAGVAMVAAFACVAAGVLARLAGWDLPGTDAYAGYAIAAALFLALPHTLRRQEHIRVTLLLERLPPRGRAALELWSLVAGLALSAYLAFYAARLVWVSHAMHDVSPAADATPLWIPQIAMALGAFGLALSMAEALVARLRGVEWFEARAADDAARIE